jgi:hypothetical protein
VAGVIPCAACGVLIFTIPESPSLNEGTSSRYQAMKRRKLGPEAGADQNENEAPQGPISILHLPDDALVISVSFINKCSDLGALLLTEKRFAHFLEYDDVWREMMRLRSWNPRWKFDLFNQDAILESPQKWRREYILALRQRQIVEKGLRIIKGWIQTDFSKPWDVAGATPEAQISAIEEKIKHPLPNDLKEFMRLCGGFNDVHPDVLERVEEDCGDDWGVLFEIKPIDSWRPTEVIDDYGPSLHYDQEAISEELPFPDDFDNSSDLLDDSSGDSYDPNHDQTSHKSDSESEQDTSSDEYEFRMIDAWRSSF